MDNDTISDSSETPTENGEIPIEGWTCGICEHRYTIAQITERLTDDPPVGICIYCLQNLPEVHYEQRRAVLYAEFRNATFG